MKVAALLRDKRGTYFKITIPSDRELVQKLRMFNGARRLGLSTFRIPFSDNLADFLEENEFQFNGAYRKAKKILYEKQNPIKKIPKYEKLGLKPFKYQMEGVNFIDRFDGLALIGDEMGLGKTIQALAWIQLNRKILKKILILCPASLKLNWKEEFEKWVTKKFKIEILRGQTPYPIRGDVVIANYDILHYWVVDLKLTNFDLVVADELHFVKSDKSLRTKAYTEIVMSIPRRIGLTGTPIDNDPVEIFYIVNRLNRNIFPNYIRFIQRYCDAKQEEQKIKGGEFVVEERNGKKVKVWKQNTRKVWKRGDFVRQKELHRILTENIMIRRTHADVNIDLPDKIYSNLHFEIDNPETYNKAENDFIEYIKEKYQEIVALGEELEEVDLDDKLDAIARAPAFAKLNELKQLAAKGKMKQVVEWVHNFMKSSEQKLLLFAINKFVVKDLVKAFPDALTLVGDTPTNVRHENVKKFSTDPDSRLFIISEAGGVGLNLVAASTIGILQYPWNPGKLAQVEHRAVRIGQEAKKVMIYKFVAKDTIEERIISLLGYKQSEIDKIVDGKDTPSQKKLINLLLDSYRK